MNLVFQAPWVDFPSQDDYRDATCYNQWLESIVRKYPEQYLWQHRRFKTRPPGDTCFLLYRYRFS